MCCSKKIQNIQNLHSTPWEYILMSYKFSPSPTGGGDLIVWSYVMQMKICWRWKAQTAKQWKYAAMWCGDIWWWWKNLNSKIYKSQTLEREPLIFNLEHLPFFKKNDSSLWYFAFVNLFCVANVSKDSPYWLMDVTLRRQIKPSIRSQRLSTALVYIAIYCLFSI